eukprot:15411036-Alexandrium_andersonii.AAC.1
MPPRIQPRSRRLCGCSPPLLLRPSGRRGQFGGCPSVIGHCRVLGPRGRDPSMWRWAPWPFWPCQDVALIGGGANRST